MPKVKPSDDFMSPSLESAPSKLPVAVLAMVSKSKVMASVLASTFQRTQAGKRLATGWKRSNDHINYIYIYIT
jgi:hypothetical protein